MNCIIYGTKCEYTTAWPQQAEKRKDAPEQNGNGRSRSRKKQRISDDEDEKEAPSTHSRSPTAEEEERLEAECSAQSVTDAADPINSLPDRAAEVELEEKGIISSERDPLTVLVHDRLGKELVHFLTPMMTGVEHEDDIGESLEDTGLPPPQVTEALIDAYFDNVHPLYPIIDESSFRIQLQQYYESLQHVDRLWLLLVKIMMCTAAAACHDAPSLGHDIKGLREQLFVQAISSSYLIYNQAGLRNTQILILISLYSIQMKKLNTAWLWVRWCIRMQTHWSHGRQRSMKEPLDVVALKDMVLWTSFMIESHLALTQFRDDGRLLEAKLKAPSEEVKRKYPVFCHRLALARLTQRFTRLGVDSPAGPTVFTDRFEQVYASILTWKDSVPIGYQPEGDIFAEREEYQCVLFMHLEYHTLLLAMFTALGAASRLAPKEKTKASSRVRNQIAIRISNARRLLTNINSITDTAHLQPCVSSWLNAIQILSPFSFLYSHIMRRPSLLSTRSDLDLLYSATRHFRQFMNDSARNKNIATLITSMYDAAAKFVSQSRAAGALPGPQTCTPGALADHFSDLPGENNNSSNNNNNNNKRRLTDVSALAGLNNNSVNSNTNTNTPVGEPGEFDYSPTVDGSLDQHGGAGALELNTSFPVHMPGAYTPYSAYSGGGHDFRMHAHDARFCKRNGFDITHSEEKRGKWEHILSISDAPLQP
ncbi:hypothetical protein EG328_010959 [Venturia inaequalis]|uniref:Xylanolytic transcriptional activator regulatory domain-containing protein n=1 Tax=Venturia inaequalis TaxID=5025 RepID=A0A8H3U6C9_VENIN|nr:hypothetical protein EG328_010959 [Venturia inaequalis]